MVFQQLQPATSGLVRRDTSYIPAQCYDTCSRSCLPSGAQGENTQTNYASWLRRRCLHDCSVGREIECTLPVEFELLPKVNACNTCIDTKSNVTTNATVPTELQPFVAYCDSNSSGNQSIVGTIVPAVVVPVGVVGLAVVLSFYFFRRRRRQQSRRSPVDPPMPTLADKPQLHADDFRPEFEGTRPHAVRTVDQSKMTRRLSRDDYTVGWVCALPDELTAAQEMLDEEHQDHPPNSNDSNIYTLGAIGAHNVVLACLPAGQTGTNSAAAVAMQMKTTFPAIRFGLMVGIGGGVPSKEADIWLGDVVVSQPENGHGGVVQYDFGKSTPSGFKRTGFINAPPTILLAAITKLRSNLDRGRTSLSPHLSKLSNLPKFDRDQAGSDVLFEAKYNHGGEDSCASCAASRKIQRTERTKNTSPMIHYGTIASGNQVMRDGVERDKISSEFGGVLCFEMEAAGLMNTFPCLVIRGICDYADSHKNKRWQPYAAGTAAAYAKELLGVIPAADVVNTQTVDEALRG